MATAQPDLSGRELRSRLSLLTADPNERSGPTSLCNSTSSCASSDSTEVYFGPSPAPPPWDVVKKQHEAWISSPEFAKSVAEYIRKRDEQREQEFKRRGLPVVGRIPILVSFDVDPAARNLPKQASADVNAALIKPRLPLRRSARIAQIHREQNLLASQKASQPSRKGPTLRMRQGRPPKKLSQEETATNRGRPPTRRSQQETISQEETATNRGRPPTRRSRQEENSQSGSTKRRGRPRNILPTPKNTGPPQSTAPRH